MACTICRRQGHNAGRCPFKDLVQDGQNRDILSVMKDLVQENAIARDIPVDRLASWATKIIIGT